jgi:hypothetical protein
VGRRNRIASKSFVQRQDQNKLPGRVALEDRRLRVGSAPCGLDHGCVWRRGVTLATRGSIPRSYHAVCQTAPDPDTRCSACLSLEGAGKSSSEIWQLYLNIVARINIEFSKMTARISSTVSSHRSGRLVLADVSVGVKEATGIGART